MRKHTLVKAISRLFIVPVLILMTGCNGTAGRTLGTVIGTGLGAWGGTVLGKKLGGKTGQIIGGITGGAAGAFLGNQIGSLLDPEEQQRASLATQRALESPAVGSQSTTVWSSPNHPGTSGGTTVTQQVDAGGGVVCKRAVNFVKVKGQDVSQPETYCRNPQTGTWTLQA